MQIRLKIFVSCMTLFLVGVIMAMTLVATDSYEQGRRSMCANVGGDYLMYSGEYTKCAITMKEKHEAEWGGTRWTYRD